MANELAGKTAAVTGSASGIGRASAEAMLAAGATVVFVDRDAKALEEVCGSHENAIPLVFDLLNTEECKTLMPKLLELLGHLDIFHANAGSYIGGDLVDADNDAIDRMLNLNINVVMKNVHDVLPHMIERKTGDVIVTSSLAAHYPTPWEPVYASSKWAIDCFIQTTRRQVFKHGLRVARSLNMGFASAASHRVQSSPACSRTGRLKNFRKPATRAAWSKRKKSLRSFSSCSRVPAT